MKKLSSLTTPILVVALLLFIVGSVDAKGRKYGLFVGINEYPDPVPQLAGCVNDATNLQQALVGKFGFAAADTTLLSDADATRQKIIDAINAYSVKASMGDLFVFTYSGHGTLFPDKHSEQIDETKKVFMKLDDEVIYPLNTYDSAICPIDSDEQTSGKPWGNLILDDEIYTLLSQFTRKGANVIFLSDSCHSGSVSKAPSTKYRVRMVPLATVFKAKSFGQLKLRKPKAQRPGRAPAKILAGKLLAMTGSLDNEFSLDWRTAEDVPVGLFTHTLLSTIDTKGTKVGYKDLMKIVSDRVAVLSATAENNQHPQLDLRFFKGNANTKVFSAP